MIHNDVLRSVRYMLDISDNKMVEIIKLGGMDVTKEDLLTYLKKDEEEGFVFCPDEVMAHFLDGLVIFKRGKDESRPPQPISAMGLPRFAGSFPAGAISSPISTSSYAIGFWRGKPVKWACSVCWFGPLYCSVSHPVLDRHIRPL